MQPSCKSRGAQSGNATSQPSSWPRDKLPLWVIFWFLVFQVLGYLTAVVCPGAFETLSGGISP